MSLDLHQFESRPLREVRVVGEDLNSPLDLLGDALAGTVAAGKEFEVGRIVVRSRLHAMMNGLVGVKLSAEKLLHDVAVLENFAAFYPVLIRKTKANIALLRDLPSHFAAVRGPKPLIPSEKISLLKSAAAWVAASERSVFGVTGRGERHSANSARSALRGGSPLVRAFSRTVHGVFVEFLSILAKFSRHPAERFSALLALETGRLDRAWAAVNRFVPFVACEAAEFTAGVSRLGAENLTALKAGKLDRHVLLLTPWKQAALVYGMIGVLSTEEIL